MVAALSAHRAWFAEWEIERRVNVSAIDAEIRGEIPIPLDDDRTFYAVGARRPHRAPHATAAFAILDYKTGQPPTGKQVRMGLSPQLTLEAAILREGGFDGIRGGRIGQRTRLMSGSAATIRRAKQKPLELKINQQATTPQPPDDAADEARDKLESLIRAFENEAPGLYLARSADVDEPLRRLRRSRAHQGMVRRRRRWGSRNGDGAAPHSADAVARHAGARSDPAASAFVSANAGSGKTHVLVQRVIRLLLNDVPPEKILCITFTKAAAANMAERVFSTLGHWVTLDDERARRRDRARPASRGPMRSCACARANCSPSALETPGGLKVQTIHALCTRLLQQFPFEANVPARFTVLDDRDQTEMMERANLAVLLDASARSGQRRPAAR